LAAMKSRRMLVRCRVPLALQADVGWEGESRPRERVKSTPSVEDKRPSPGYQAGGAPAGQGLKLMLEGL